MWGWHLSSSVAFVPRPKAAPKARVQRVERNGPSLSSSSSLDLASRLPVVSVLRERSRSPGRDGLPGLRSDAPGRRAMTTAQLPRILSEEDKAEACRLLDKDILSSTTNRTHAARLKTIGVALSLWGLPMWPLTPTSMKAVASTLKHGGYSSAHLYLMAYKTEAERRGQSVSEALRRSILDYSRSCLRGLGAPSRPKALPMDRLHLLPRGFEPWVAGGPVNPRAMVMCGAWWLCREIELASQRARLL